jgi:hypothetical protein
MASRQCQAWAAYEKAKALERESMGRPKEGVERIPQDNSRSRDAIGARVGVSGSVSTTVALCAGEGGSIDIPFEWPGGWTLGWSG